MRLTLDLNSFKDFGEAAFASLWLDTELHRWSRESHELLDLPKWGILVSTTGETQLCDQSETDPVPIVSLEKLRLDRFSESPQAHESSEPPGPHDRSSGPERTRIDVWSGRRKEAVRGQMENLVHRSRNYAGRAQ